MAHTETPKVNRVVVIDRRTWRYGGHGLTSLYGKTQLLNDEGFRCCLGFALQQLEGLSDEELLHEGSPASLNRDMKVFTIRTHSSQPDNSDFSYKAIYMNDDALLTKSDREAELVRLGKEVGIAFEFVGEYR